MSGTKPCGELLLETLRDWGAKLIFGIPGDFVLPFFKVIEESGILPLYTLSHEPGVGFAADAAARYDSCLSVAAVTFGAGGLNMVNAIAGAYAEKSPVVVISGAPGVADKKRGLLLHHQVQSIDSPMCIFEEITCAQTRLDDPQTVVDEIKRVLGAAVKYSQPVYIELPRDMVTVPVPTDGDAALQSVRQRAQADEGAGREAIDACAAEILKRISQADRPVLMAGIEIRRYGVEAEFADLAARLSIPVVTSFMGRGLLASAAIPPLGTYLGRAGDREIAQLVEESDALVLMGVIPSDTNFAAGRKPVDFVQAIHVTEREVRLGHHSYFSIPLPALIAAMTERVGGDVTVPPSTARQAPELPGKDDGPVTSRDVALAVNAIFAASETTAMPIASDTGDCLFCAMEIEHTALVAPGYYSSMGFGVPAGIGLQAASGLRPLILVGDGAFQMTGWELGNCRRYGFDPIVLLFNNQSWAMLRAFQPESKFNELDDWHYADLAPQLGGRGERVTTRDELQAALARAIEAPGQFYLIEIMLAEDTISPTLERFVDALKGGAKQERAK